MKMKNQARVRFLLPVLTLVCCLFAGTASAQSVPVTLRVSDAPLEQVLSAIEKQTTYLFVYDKNVDVARRGSIDVKDTPLNNVLNTLFQSSDIAYAVENTSIVLSQKAPAAQPGQPVTVTGKVVDASGMPVIGAAVIVKGTTIGTSTGVDGDFSLQVPPPSADAVLEINYLGYEEDSESVNIYLESEKVIQPKKVETAVSLLYNLFDDQLNIVHIIVNGNRKSQRLNYPDRYLYQNF